ncbi:hypothetical protein NOR_01874 [Metarhizium rileyi]|uniref:Histone chaperone domain-containing protein n=1 Tax=Metarhizium rileyi (strain RCEF 4871) TaxID=1649241 RepID=A0A167I3E9_METRR|nr:hypothetical protein NOR_01874 [Metarhizium rileyi RCEF 4871]TWU74440.1 hypothetical protein ED733_004355 [Metarhizium rileyi]
MSKSSYAQTDDKVNEADFDANVPGGQVQDNSYATRKSEAIPVQSDNAPVEDPVDATNADSDKQLERDEKEAIDKSNIIKQRTREAQPRGQYKEPDDAELGLT